MTTQSKPLFTAQDLNTIPRLYAQDGKGMNATVFAHIFGAVGDWWITEIDGEGETAFGYTKLTSFPDGEWGYISIQELQDIANQFFENKDIRYLLERDEHWTPKPMNDCLNWTTQPRKGLFQGHLLLFVASYAIIIVTRQPITPCLPTT